MGWITQTPVVAAHRCTLPMRDVMVRPPRGPAVLPRGKTLDDYPEHAPMKVDERPDGAVGSVWRCDGCGTLWHVIPPEPRRYENSFGSSYPRWRKAGMWLRFWHRHEGV